MRTERFFCPLDSGWLYEVVYYYEVERRLFCLCSRGPVDAAAVDAVAVDAVAVDAVAAFDHASGLLDGLLTMWKL